MTASRPTVSVIVPVLNAAATLERCLDGLRRQEYPGEKFEIICIDNGSEDGSREILERHSGDITILTEGRRGAAAARNTGIRQARHTFLAFLDADCVPEPAWIRELVACGENHPDADFVGGRIAALNPRTALERFTEKLYDHQAAIEGFHPPSLITANLLVRRDRLRHTGHFDETFLRGQDTELAFRAFFWHGSRFVYSERAVVSHVCVRSLRGLVAIGVRHGRGAARIAEQFGEEIHTSQRRRCTDPRAYGRILRLLGRFVSGMIRPGHQDNPAERKAPLYEALFRSGKQIGLFLPLTRTSPKPVPKATLVVPLLRQNSAWLRKCLLSALQQTVPCEVLVVTSPRTPSSTRDLLAGLQARYDLLRITEREPDKAFGGAINRGIRMAACDRVGLLLSDDWIDPPAVETCLSHSTDIVSTGMRVCDADGRTVYYDQPVSLPEYQARPTLEAKASYLRHFFLFNRDKLLEIGGVDETIGLTGADDYDMIWTLLEEGATVTVVEECLYNWRDHFGERLTLRSAPDQIRDLEKILAKHGVDPAETKRLVTMKKKWYGEPLHVVKKNNGIL